MDNVKAQLGLKMATILKGLGIINIVFGLVIVFAGLLSSLIWTWMHQNYAVFVWGGCLVSLI